MARRWGLAASSFLLVFKKKLCSAWFHRWPMCFIAPDRNVRCRGDLKPRDPESGMCFDHALVILGRFLFYNVQRVLTCGDWWPPSPACWGETRRPAKARARIPLPRDAAAMDDIVWSFRKRPLKRMWRELYVFSGSTTSCYLYFSLFTWKCSENFTEHTLFFCFHVAFFPIVLIIIPHFTVWCRLLLKWIYFPDHTTCSAETVPQLSESWLNKCVYVCVCIKGLSYSIKCTLWW